jgi:flagellar biosynthesis protein FliQ
MLSFRGAKRTSGAQLRTVDLEVPGSMLRIAPERRPCEERETTMTGAETLDVARDAIWTIVVVSSPLMVIGLVVGVVVSLFQALTQIQEQTLIFVPKILAIFVTLLLALPFMADSMHSHMMRISSRIIGG